MASGGKRRMVFDTRGRRKHVVRVVYAVLALLMGASLFVAVGPVNLASLIGTQSSSSSAAKVFEEQAERIEARLVKDPTDEGTLLSLTRARIGAGNALLETNPETGAATLTPEAQTNFQIAEVVWRRYLKQVKGEPAPAPAQLVAATFFRLAESAGGGLAEVEADVATATDAQRAVAAQRPSLGSLGTLAKFQYYNGEFAGGDKSTKQAAAKAGSKAEGKAVEKQLDEFRKLAKEFAKQKKQIQKVESEAGKEQLTNPFGGLGGSSPPPPSE